MTFQNRPVGRRSLLHTLHLVAGVVLCLPLVVLGLTGSLLVFGHEIDDWMDPTPRVAASGAPWHGIADIVDAARAAGPANSAPTAFIAGGASDAPAEVRLRARTDASPGFGGVRIFVDPASLMVLGAREASASVARQIELLHANMLVRDRSGRSFVGWLGVVMLGLGVSGLVLWWPRRWRHAFRIHSAGGSVALLREIHRTVGFWGLVVFLVVSFSGVYLAFPQTITDGVASVLPARDMRANVGLPPIARPDPQARLDVDRAVRLASDAVTKVRLRAVFWPQRPDQPLRIVFARTDAFDGAPPVTVLVDPWAGRVLEVRDPRTYSAGETLLAWLRPLHSGDGLGWPWRLLTFLSGFLPPLFAISGTAMWLLKRRSRAGHNVRRRPAEIASD